MPKIPALPSLATITGDDYIVIEDISSATTRKIKHSDFKVYTENIPDNSITTNMIKAGEITNEKFANYSIDSSKFKVVNYYKVASDYNPLPTTPAIIPNSTINITVTKPSVIDLTITSKLQNNSSAYCDVVLMHNDVAKFSVKLENNSAEMTVKSQTKRRLYEVGVGTHKFELRCYANQPARCVAYDNKIIANVYTRV
jgi:hypothetical protein